MTVTEMAAAAFVVAGAGVIVFQIALALGAPWGAYAMGGAFPGQFPPAMRVAALVQAALFGVLATIVLSRAGLALPSLGESFPWLIWIVVAVSGVSLVLNSASRSAVERRLWVPVALVLLVCSLTVALTAG